MCCVVFLVEVPDGSYLIRPSKTEVTSDQTDVHSNPVVRWNCARSSLIRPFQTEVTPDQPEIIPLSRLLCVQNYHFSGYFELKISDQTNVRLNPHMIRRTQMEVTSDQTKIRLFFRLLFTRANSQIL